MQCGTHSKHFPTHQMMIRPLRHITEDMKISILPTVPNGLMQKKSLLLRKLGTVEHKFVNYILPKKTCELGFLETVKLLSKLFSSKTSLFHKRWKCLNITKRDSDDYLGFASVINKNCDDFKRGELLADNFKCLIFVQGLVSAKNAEIRRRVLSKLENESNLTLQKLAEDCQRIVRARKDSKNIEESGVAYVRKVKHRSQSYSPVKERKYMTIQNFNTGRLVTTKKKKHPALATAVEKYIGPRTVPIVQKDVKTAINLDISTHNVERENN